MHAAQLPDAAMAPVIVAVGASASDPGGAIRIPVRVAAATEVGALSAVLTYDPGWPGTVTCIADSGEGFDLEVCHVDPSAGVVRFSLVSPAGVSGELTFGEVVVTPPEREVITAPLLALQTVVAAAHDGTLLPIQASQEAPSDQLYLPVIVR
jgi:hypothetical protein